MTALAEEPVYVIRILNPSEYSAPQGTVKPAGVDFDGAYIGLCETASGSILCQREGTPYFDIILCDGSKESPRIYYRYMSPAIPSCVEGYQANDSTLYLRLSNYRSLSLTYSLPKTAKYEYTAH